MVELTVDKWNENVLSGFEDLEALVSGLATPIMENQDSKSFPAIVTADGEAKYVFADDANAFGMYHRLLNVDYSRSKASYGDRERMTATAELMLVCWGWLEFNSALDMERKLHALSPKEVQFINSNFDRKQVFNSEFSGVGFFLPPELYLFSSKYRVSYQVDKNCV